MIPPALYSIPVYPGLEPATAIRATLGDATAEPRTIEELRSRQTEIEQKIRASVGTDSQLRALNREKRRLLQAIRDKEIADGFMNGALVPFIDERQGRQICTFVPSSDKRRHIQKVACKIFKKHRREFNVSNFDEMRERNPRQVGGLEDGKPMSGRGYCSVQKGSTRSVEILAPGHQDRPKADNLETQEGQWVKA